jgi:Tfp pilus assembly protein PilZ
MSDDGTRPERKHRRCTVRILTEYEAGALRATAFATTLGGGGLFLETDCPLPRNTPITVCFRVLPGRPPHRISGRVVWSHAPASSGIGRTSGMGIEFTDGQAAARVAQELDALPA